MLRVYLDDFLLDENPLGVAELKHKIARDTAFNILTVQNEGVIEFTSRGYHYLRKRFDANIYREVRCRIQKLVGNTWETKVDAYLVLSTIQFNKTRNTARVSLVDKSWNWAVKNNIRIIQNPENTVSKTKETISSTSPDNVQMFNPSLGLWNSGFTVSGDRDVYPVKDYIQNMLDFMSDGAITFESDFLDNFSLNRASNTAPAVSNIEDDLACELGVLSGYEMRAADQSTFPQTSLEAILNSLIRIFNLKMYMFPDNTLRLEGADYEFRNKNFTIIELPNSDDVLEEIDQDLLFTRVLFGADKVWPSYPTPVSYRADKRFFSHNNESYYIGDSNNDIGDELDLTVPLIVDNNILYNVLVNNDDEYDEDVFLIAYDSSSAKQIAEYDAFDAATPNNFALNSEIAARYRFFGNLSRADSSVAEIRAKANPASDLTFSAAGSSFPLAFSSEVYDTGNDYSGSTFTVPTTGTYYVQARLYYRITGASGSYDVRFHVRKNGTRVGRVFQFTAAGRQDQNPNGDPHFYDVPINAISCTAADTLVIELEVVSLQASQNIVLLDSSDVVYIAANDGSGMYRDVDSSLAPVKVFSSETIIPDDLIDSILANPNWRLKVGGVEGAIKELNTNILTGETDLKLIDNDNS